MHQTIENACAHKWRDEICACCEYCGQRHNSDKCANCGQIKPAKISCDPKPFGHDANRNTTVKHYINYIVQQFAYSANPIDTEERAAMNAKLIQYRDELEELRVEPKSWKEFIVREMKKDYFRKLAKFLSEEEKQFTIYPKKQDVFKAFDLCPLDRVKCVIVGYDPYINPGEAMGLSFSVPDGIKIPPSLRNIFKEIQNDLQTDHQFKSGNLTKWAEEGVLLLNSILTVRQNETGSHKSVGWEKFSDNAIKLLDTLDGGIVYLLWGKQAQAKSVLITNKKSLTLTAGHPSPLNTSHNFFGNHHFSQANAFLVKTGLKPVEWRI